MKSTPANYPPIRFRGQERLELQDELALLKAERDELRRAVAFAGLLIADIGTANVNSPANLALAREWLDQAGAVLAKGKG